MKVLNLQQGSAEWLARRPKCRNASDAPVVMGVSPYKTREELLREKKLGITPEVTPAQQAVFNEGHRVEPLLRAMCERVIGEDLSPLCAESDDGYTSASFDGVDMLATKLFEGKQHNCEKIAAIREQRIPEVDYWQCVQQFDVCETAQILYYYCGDGEPNSTAYYTQLRTPQIEADIVKLRAAWAQFDKDLAAWKPSEPVAPAPIGHAPETLPALAVQITGAVTASNLPQFKERALWLIRGVKTELVTDQDFADAEITVKWCATIEQKLKDAKDRALAQTASISELFHAIDEISAEARRTRLDLDKLVKAEKLNRKVALGRAAVVALEQHVAGLNRRLGATYIQPVQHFSDAIKGMSSLASMAAALDAALANAKVEANQRADQVDANLRYLAQFQEFAHLFPDLQTLALKAEDDFCAAADARILQAREAERQRLEAERERIRAEEEAKAKAAADAAVAKMAAEAEAEVQAEAKAKTDAERAGCQQQAEAEARAAQRVRAKQATEAAAHTQPTLTLGAINLRLEPIHLTAAGLAKLGIEPKATDRAAKLYTEGQFFNLLCELTDHLDRAMSKVRRAQTEAEAA